jgi:arylsulfatase A-like enzyme
MNNSRWNQLAFTLVLVTSSSSIECLGDDARPNILFIMSDDHTTQAFGCYGSRLAKLNPTPNIDRLATEGMRFDRVFCNYSLCTPSRASIITGQYPQTHGVMDLGGSISPANQHLAHEMKRGGYHTAMIGKWHLKAEPAPFDYYCVFPGQGKYHNPVFRVRGDKAWPRNTIQKRGQHSSDAVTDVTIEWLKNGWNRDKPFFLMHHFKAPHDMFENATRYDEYLEDVTIPEPTNLFGQRARVPSQPEARTIPWCI